MQKETFDISIAIEGAEAVTFTGLTREQTKVLSALTATSYSETEWRLLRHRTPRTWAERIGATWRRFSAWAAPLLLLVALSGVGMAQERQVRAVEPIKLEVVAASQEPEAEELRRQVYAALRRRGDITFPANGRVDYSIALTATRLADGKCQGVVAAMLIVASDRQPLLSIHSASDVDVLAEHLVKELAQKFALKGND